MEYATEHYLETRPCLGRGVVVVLGVCVRLAHWFELFLVILEMLRASWVVRLTCSAQCMIRIHVRYYQEQQQEEAEEAEEAEAVELAADSEEAEEDTPPCP
jgi:hypothetical protein